MPPRKKDPQPPGRPSRIDQPITLADGSSTTIGARIVDLIGTTGAYAERAARSAGVPKATFYGWLERAALAREKLAQHPSLKLPAHDVSCMQFADAVEDAEARYEMTSLTALERLGQGVVRLETVVEKYEVDPTTGEGKLVERTVKSTGLAPNPNVIMWKLVRKFPERYRLHHDAGAAASASDNPIDLTPARIAEMVNDVEEFTRQFDEV